jgi:hypothetical protein
LIFVSSFSLSARQPSHLIYPFCFGFFILSNLLAFFYGGEGFTLPFQRIFRSPLPTVCIEQSP